MRHTCKRDEKRGGKRGKPAAGQSRVSSEPLVASQQVFRQQLLLKKEEIQKTGTSLQIALWAVLRVVSVLIAMDISRNKRYFYKMNIK